MASLLADNSAGDMQPQEPRFVSPPVVEVVLGAQFAPLTNFTSGHLGWFWKGPLGEEWSRAVDAPPLPDQFETFEQHRWSPPAFQVKLESPARPRRLQISNRAGDRLVQVQETRFIYNWQKKEGEAVYPSFVVMLTEFEELFRRFRDFAATANLGEVTPNQWEVTYVDQVPRGELWQSAADWHRVFPGLFGPHPGIEGLGLEEAGGEWHYEISPARGRLHLSVQRGVTGRGEPALMLQTTVRGPVGKGAVPDLVAGLNLGHDISRRAFFSITSPEAQAAWEKKA